MALIKTIIKLVISVACLLLFVTIVGLIIAQVQSWGNKSEGFDKDGIEFTGYGKIKYDMKGEKVKSRNITNCYFDKRICYDNTFGNTEQNSQKFKPL